jgi:hypothetical protein
MTFNEDFERKMAFIADQQAQFAIGMQELREGHAETQKAHAETEKAIAQAEAIVARLAYATLEGFKDTNAKINALVDSQIGMDDSYKRTEKSHRGIEEALRELIRCLSSHRN